MAYNKLNFKNGETLLDADNLNYMEEGIFNSYATLLIAVSEEEPETFEEGDRYYNITENKIYLSKNNIWVDEGEPLLNKFYVEIRKKNSYVYNGETLISVGGNLEGFVKLEGGEYEYSTKDVGKIFYATERTVINLFSGIKDDKTTRELSCIYEGEDKIYLSKGMLMLVYPVGWGLVITILNGGTKNDTIYQMIGKTDDGEDKGTYTEYNVTWEKENIGNGAFTELNGEDYDLVQEDYGKIFYAKEDTIIRLYDTVSYNGGTLERLNNYTYDGTEIRIDRGSLVFFADRLGSEEYLTVIGGRKLVKYIGEIETSEPDRPGGIYIETYEWRETSIGGGNTIYVTEELPTIANDGDLYIDENGIEALESEVVNSLEGNEIAKAPSVKAINEKFENLLARTTLQTPLTKTNLSLTDNNIKKAKFIVVYCTFGYSLSDPYITSMFINPELKEWYEFSTSRTTDRGYVKIDKANGTMLVSQYSNTNFAVIGYDVITF